MTTPIKTNQLIYTLDHKKIDEQYDIFIVQTSMKYFKSGAYIIDAPVLEQNVCAVRFLNGKRFYVLMRHDVRNKQLLRKALSNAEDADTITISQTNSSELENNTLLQLMLNSLGSVKHPFLRFNNLTGHLYCFHPDWVRKSKKDNVIWQVPCLEISITPECRMKFDVRTFTSELLKKKITFQKRKFEDYPKYVFSVHNTLRRKLRGDKETAFIQRQIDGEKTSNIDFLHIRSIKDFEKSKMGIVTSVILQFNEQLAGLVKVDFDDITDYRSIDYDRNTAKENVALIQSTLDNASIRIVDGIGDEYSLEFCNKIQSLLQGKYHIFAPIGKRITKNCLNLYLIHNAAYYLDGNDPHQKQYHDSAVQHITFEDFSGHEEYAISTVVHELLIKSDLKAGKISLFDWTSLNLNEDISFGMCASDEFTEHYFFIHIHPDGSFFIIEQEPSLFEQTEYSDCVQIFEDAKLHSETIKGIIRDSHGNINIIKDTGWVTIPEIFRIHDELENGNTALRGKEMRENLLSSVIDIKYFQNDNAAYYFVGTIGAGMKYLLHTAANIRKIEPYGSASLLFESLLPLMNVTFVRNGQLTIIPFPFKYLREHILSLGYEV